MNVTAVSHFVEEATSIGVVPDMPPMVCSWITAPSAATIRIMPSDSPAERTRSSSSASVGTNVSGAKSLRTAVVVVVVVVTPTVVGIGMEVDVNPGAVRALDAFVPDDPQPTSSSPDATNATARRAHAGEDVSAGVTGARGGVRRARSRPDGCRPRGCRSGSPDADCRRGPSTDAAPFQLRQKRAGSASPRGTDTMLLRLASGRSTGVQPTSESDALSKSANSRFRA